MYDIDLYETSCGNIPIKDFLSSFGKGDVKSLSKINLYIEMLKEYGPDISKKFRKEATKSVINGIFELRPDKHRVLFFYFTNHTIVLLHGFRKTTNKIPKKEIENAIKEMNDYKERHRQ